MNKRMTIAALSSAADKTQSRPMTYMTGITCAYGRPGFFFPPAVIPIASAECRQTGDHRGMRGLSTCNSNVLR